jgi:hypothetical protein
LDRLAAALEKAPAEVRAAILALAEGRLPEPVHLAVLALVGTAGAGGPVIRTTAPEATGRPPER